MLLFTLLSLAVTTATTASEQLLQTHCASCHNEEKAKGKFKLAYLGKAPSQENIDRWLDSLDYITAEEMPPEEDSELSSSERQQLAAFFQTKIDSYGSESTYTHTTPKRRMNNREFRNSLRDALLLEDVAVYQATSELVGDKLYHGFDTHGESLGFSRFHLEQYLEAIRSVVDRTIISGPQPPTQRYEIPAERIERSKKNQNSKRPAQRGKDGVFDFRGPEGFLSFMDLRELPASGHYTIQLRCKAMGRTRYSSDDTGMYHGDPMQLEMGLGDTRRTFDLPDDEEITLSHSQWLPAGTAITFRNPTDGLKQIGNGNFKFQYGMMPKYLKRDDPDLYEQTLESILSNRSDQKRQKDGAHWSLWVDVWDGPQIHIYDAVVEGPFYQQWPSQQQVSLVGQSPSVEGAEEILRPIAERAWRRAVDTSELQRHIALVESCATDGMATIDALKEGIISVLMSPNFLFLDPASLDETQTFASKLSTFTQSTLPDQQLSLMTRAGLLDNPEQIADYLRQQLDQGDIDTFLHEFPFAWLELADINFMAPDPDNYRHYHRKDVSIDMIAEVRHFFRHALEANVPITEFLTADYSFVNADLAQVYGLDDVPQDSTFRKYTFTDGRRGGLLGMGAFLTVTADSLTTSPIHRAVFVMENFMGIHPSPPPPDIEITEPDVRKAKTVKEILAAHTENESCATCHKAIDPWGYAFENYDSMGAWRDVYKTVTTGPVVTDKDPNGDAVEREKELQKTKRTKALVETVAIDSSATFRNGTTYEDIHGYRDSLLTPANRDRFVKCFIAKLLLYANGVEPKDEDHLEIDRILDYSSQHEYRVLETIAAVIDSPLFRN